MPSGATALPLESAASYWAATAGAGPSAPPLTQDIDVDAAVIGAGFTGLSAAYHLLGRGRSCVVLDGNAVAWGASGRTGGMVVPRYKHTFSTLASRYGADTARRMHRLAHDAVDLLERIVQDEKIDCGFARCGHLTPMVHARDIARFESDRAWLASEAADHAPRMLDRDETAELTGTSFYEAAYFEPRGGAVHPLRLCYGLANRVIARGGRIAGLSPALSWRANGDGFMVRTPHADVRCRDLLFATNGYTDLQPAGVNLARRVVPVISSLIATEPLPETMRRSVLPRGHVATDAKRLTNYYRVTPDGRMVFGGRGGASNRESAGVYRRLETEMGRIFPQLRGAPIAFRWSGRVAVTRDGLPRVGRNSEGALYAMGYNGRGVALSILLGRAMAELATGAQADLGPLAGAFAPIPFHALQVPGKKIVTTYYRVLDALGR